MRDKLRRHVYLLYVLAFFLTPLNACGTLEVQVEGTPAAELSPAEPSRPASPTSPTPPTPEGIVAARASAVIQALKNRDMEALSTFVHPTGVRFSAYAFVQESDLVFMPDQIKGLLADPTPYIWGAYNGSGLPIELSFAEYYDQFVYDQDFANAEQIGYNQIIGMGNTINNCFEFYPGAMVVEYHFSGFAPAFEGMDWKSLRLVFQDAGGLLYLVGVIHDGWTI